MRLVSKQDQRFLALNNQLGALTTAAATTAALALKANLAGGATFTGTVVLPSTTSIGTVTNTEISYLDGVTSAIQTQIGTKLTAVIATAQIDSVAADTATIVADFNALLAKLRTAGILTA